MSKKAMRIVSLILAVFCLCIFLASCADKDENKEDYIRLSDITFPEHLDTDNLFGLFFINRDGTVTNSTEELDKVNYDPAKPLIIFVHGMQWSYGYERYDDFANKDGILDAGYNYGVFIWSQPSDTDMPWPAGVSSKIWGREGSFRYKDENGERVKESTDVIPYSIAECFVAYYMDFMNRAGFNGKEIIFVGHSLGANTMSGISSYMLTKAKQGKMSKEFLPDRIVFCDAYWEASKDDTYVDWLGETVGENGVFGRTKEVVDLAREFGIVTEYVESSTISRLVDVWTFTPGLAQTLLDKFLCLNLSCEYASNKHVASYTWYLGGFTAEPHFDKNAESQFAFGVKMPLSVAFARSGVQYAMDKNKTEGQSDDIIYAMNITSPKIAGFAFKDENNNGINDDRVKNRVAGVKVELYKNDEKIAETVTTSGGYYEFTEGVVNGGTYKVKVDGTEIGTVSDGGYMNNGIKADGYSEEFSIISDIDLKIINIGVR